MLYPPPNTPHNGILLSKKFLKSEIDPCKLFKWITKTDAKEIIFKNLPYRYQIISEKVINDSKCTNFHALKYAIKKTNKKFFDSEYILIVTVYLIVTLKISRHMQKEA